MPKITKYTGKKEIIAKTQTKNDKNLPSDWWNSSDLHEMGQKMLSTVLFLRERNQARVRQNSFYAALYGNIPLSGAAGIKTSYSSNQSGNLKADRPTMSVITSCVDTVVSRLAQDRPSPIFLTENGDYKQRKMAKEMNRFILGEFYQTQAYEIGEEILRDSCVLGDGIVKILEDDYKRVSLERRLSTELLVDPNDSYYGKRQTRQIYEFKLVERSVLHQRFPKYSKLIETADQAFIDDTAGSDETVSDLVLVAEGWHLKSGPYAKDGIHALACSSGVLSDDTYDKKFFPFVNLRYAPCMQGFWSQGLPARQMGTQLEINKLLKTISQSINLMGVPRVFIEKGSAISKGAFNNEVGSVHSYSGSPPIFSVADCIAPEVYAQLQRLISYAYEQEGVSQLSSIGQKPAGVDSGEALRTYDRIQDSRFTSLQQRWQKFYEELAYQMIDKAVDIAERDGKYQTVYPDKDGTQEIDLPKFRKDRDDFIIQCYNTSGLPKDPVGRLEKIGTLMQSGIYTPEEGRRLLGFPDTEQVDQLANAPKERILKMLDQIVEEGKFTPPDPFTNVEMAIQLVDQYYNLYVPNKLEESRAQQLRDFSAQAKEMQQMIMMQAQADMMAAMPQQPQAPQPLAQPMPTPQNELIQNTA